MVSATHVEDLEISFAAFVNSARSTTFILQKEFKTKESFIKWYGNPDCYENGKWTGEEAEPTDTKIYEMAHDELCKFFVSLRNQITKEGINGFVCSTNIRSFNSNSDLIDQPPGSSIQFRGNGIYYLVGRGTSKEDSIPARTRAVVTTQVALPNTPSVHLRSKIPDSRKDIINLSKIYYEYLKSLVEEWTGVINSQSV